MLPRGNKLYSIIYQKCPRCQHGDLFEAGAYNLKRFTQMPEKCSHCGQRFELEPAFYSGAMYVSYALQVALFTTVYVALRVLFNPDMFVYMYAIIGAIIILFPVTLRLSRTIYLNFFVRYDSRFDKA
ncbi:MAG: DUF983 domain-containing protein [Cyclobacteriaceae bacterium]